MTAENRLLLGDVKEGADLPVLEKDVTARTVVFGAVASRDWLPQHYDPKFANQKHGVQDIFMNTPNLAAWFERYLTDWTGPKGRIGRIKFRLEDSVFPGDRMHFEGRVTGVESMGNGNGWVDVAISLTAGEQSCVSCEARIAVPEAADANPWALDGAEWRP